MGNMEAFMQSLASMGGGMLGIFVVTGILTILVTLLNKLGR